MPIIKLFRVFFGFLDPGTANSNHRVYLLIKIAPKLAICYLIPSLLFVNDYSHYMVLPSVCQVPVVKKRLNDRETQWQLALFHARHPKNDNIKLFPSLFGAST